MELWLIRHGESAVPDGLCASTSALLELTPKGIKQAQCLAIAVRSPPYLIVVSPFVRTLQTARPMIERYPNTLIEEWPVQEFDYVHLPEGQNTLKMYRQVLIDAFWERNDPDYSDGEGLETFYSLMGRVKVVVDRIKMQNNRNILMFTHGFFIRVLVWSLLSGQWEPTKDAMKFCYRFVRSLVVPHAAIIKVRFSKGRQVWISNIVTSHIPKHLITESNILERTQG
jgi:broad specificity phosphatase PhoE